MKPTKVIAIIQARMGSSRLPGKMLEPIAGHPLLYHIITRAQRLRSTPFIYLATTEKKLDDPLVELAKKMNIKVVRGPEDNVMERFFLAIEDADADYIIRICGDAPLFDPGFLDDSVSLIAANNADCVQATQTGPVAYQGAEVISRRALEWSRRVAPDNPRTFEHVTTFALENLDKLKTVPIEIESFFYGEYKFSIDTIEDLNSIRAIYTELYTPGEILSLRKVVNFIKGGTY